MLSPDDQHDESDNIRCILVNYGPILHELLKGKNPVASRGYY